MTQIEMLIHPGPRSANGAIPAQSPTDEGDFSDHWAEGERSSVPVESSDDQAKSHSDLPLAEAAEEISSVGIVGEDEVKQQKIPQGEGVISREAGPVSQGKLAESSISSKSDGEAVRMERAGSVLGEAMDEDVLREKPNEAAARPLAQGVRFSSLDETPQGSNKIVLNGQMRSGSDSINAAPKAALIPSDAQAEASPPLSGSMSGTLGNAGPNLTEKTLSPAGHSPSVKVEMTANQPSTPRQQLNALGESKIGDRATTVSMGADGKQVIAPALTSGQAAHVNADLASAKMAVRLDGEKAHRSDRNNDDSPVFRAETADPSVRSKPQTPYAPWLSTMAAYGATPETKNPIMLTAVQTETDRAIDAEWGAQASVNSSTSTGIVTPAIFGRAHAQPVASQLAAAVLQSGGDATEIRLNPDELGRVRISLVSNDTGLTVNIQTERPETADLMRRHLDALAREFQEIGYTDLEFTFGGDGQAQNDSSENLDHQSATTNIPPESNEPTTVTVMTGGLDLKL